MSEQGTFPDFDTSDLSDEEFLQLCHDDPLWFMQVCEKIVDKQSKQLVPLVLNQEQRSVYDVFWYLWNQNKPVRLIILKARQMGISTMFQGLGYWRASTEAHQKGLVLSHEKDSAKHIFQMSERFSIYDARHARGLMPMLRRSSVSELTFGNPDKKKRASDPGLDSALTIATADNKNAGHSWTGTFFHGSEVARWPKPELLSGVLNALTYAPKTVGILESTAHGASGVFYDTWMGAVEKQNGWIPIFLPWKDRPEYRAILTEQERNEFDPTNDELNLMKAYGLNVEQLVWRRQKIAGPECQGQGRDPVDVFREQFPLDSQEAFISSGSSFFSLPTIQSAAVESRARRLAAPEVVTPTRGYLPPAKGRIRLDKPPGPVKPNKVECLLDPAGFYTFYYPPQQSEDYVVGADVAAGLSNGDWSVAYVMHRRTNKVVAKYRARIHPDKYATELVALGWLYNRAFIAVEANNIGLTTAREVAKNYSRCAYKVKLDEMGYGEQDPDRPGFYTQGNNRKELFWNLRSAIRDSTLVCYDEDFWSECADFIVPEDAKGNLMEDKPRARPHKHDDCVVAMAITLKANDPFISGPIVMQKEAIKPQLPTMQQFLSEDIQSEKKKRDPKFAFYDNDVGRW